MEVEVRTGCGPLKVIVCCDDRDAEAEEIISRLSPKPKLTGTSDGKQFLLDADGILYFESVDNKCFAYAFDAVYEVQSKLYELEQLMPAYFMRISKAGIVNITKIKSLQATLGGRILAELVNGELLCISRGYAKEFRAKIQSYGGKS